MVVGAFFMKMALVCASGAQGGLEKHVLELAEGLAQRGHEITLIGPQALVARASTKLIGRSVNFDRPRWWPGLRRALREALTGDWDVIHAHANKATELVSRCRNQVAARRWVATLHNEKKETRAFSAFDEVIVVSERLRAFVQAPRVSVVLNGIDPPQQAVSRDRPWLAQLAGLDAGRPILLSVGRLVPAKGFDRLIRAAQLAHVQVAIAGEGPERESLQALVAKNPKGISFLGARSDVPQLLSACDGLVIASRHEGGPYTLAEALLAKRPVLATRVGMVADVLPESLILPEEPAAMAAQLRQFSEDLGLWRSLCATAFAQAAYRLTLEAMIEATLSVYQATVLEQER